MPRHYKREPGKRQYKNYNDATLNQAKENVQDGKLSLYEASRRYRIPLGTLHNKLKGKHNKQNGGQTALAREEELAIIDSILIAADWGHPLSLLDLRLYTKAYLDRRNRNVSKFKNNMPGEDWAYSMLCRHKELLASKIATNIKPTRAQVGPDELKEYHKNLGETIAGVPPSNIVNYDETCMSDNPGRMKVLTRKKVKNVEKVIHHSKSCTTVMFAAAADGTLLPPYVIYKAGRMWDTWREGGPVGAPCCTERCCRRGTRYNCTPHGWMDLIRFKDWLRTIIIPHRQNKPGKFILIGDNFSAHLDDEVIQICKDNDIELICLPPNSTHLTQPLDVAFFRALKEAWRHVLQEWRKQNARSKCGLPKDLFASLLRKALERMNVDERVHHNIISAFRATGIVPYNVDELLKHLPQENINHLCSEASQALINFYKDQRFVDKPPPAKRRRTRLNVVPGKSVAATQEPESEDERSAETSNSTEESESSNDEEADEPQNTETEDDVIPPIGLIPAGSYILARFQGGNSRRNRLWFRYVCVVEKTTPEGLQVMGFQALRGSKIIFEPKERDISVISHSDILALLPHPMLVKTGRRYNYKFANPIDIKES
ncbi:hypothetical protein B566_EDAN004971 [Ephemera danica]|nr:hypothetical protein B566_EDAN004971 [Ephemera danica]